MSGRNKPVTAGTVALLVAGGAYGAYHDAQKPDDKQAMIDEVGKALEAAPPPKVPPPSFTSFDPSAIKQALQGVWVDEDNIFVVDGDFVSTYHHCIIDEAREKIAIVAPCMMELDGHRHTTFAIEPTGVRFGHAAGRRDGTTTTSCEGTTVTISTPTSCRAWNVISASSWFAATSCEPPRLVERNGALSSEHASVEPVRKYDSLEAALIAELTRAQAKLAGEHTIFDISSEASECALGATITSAGYVRAIEGSTVTLADEPARADRERTLVCLSATRHVHIGERVAVTGMLGAFSESSVDVADCQISVKPLQRG